LAKVDIDIATGLKAKKPKPGGPFHLAEWRGGIVRVQKNPNKPRLSPVTGRWVCAFSNAARISKVPEPRQFNEASTITADTGWYYRDAITSGIFGKLLTGPRGQRITTPTAQVNRSSFEALTANTLKNLTPNTKVWDNNVFWNPLANSDRLTIRSSGLYIFSASFSYTGGTGGYQYSDIANQDGLVLAFDQRSRTATNGNSISVFGMYYFNANDYIRARGFSTVASTTVQLAWFNICAITPETLIEP